MSLQLNPYLVFSGTAREAMTFYQSVFGGELEIKTFGDFGAAPSPELEDQVMNAQLLTPAGLRIMASDGGSMFPTVEGQGTPSVEVALLGEVGDQPEAGEWFRKLAEGGQVQMELQTAMWGDVFGSLTDRFGITWMVNLEAPKN